MPACIIFLVLFVYLNTSMRASRDLKVSLECHKYIRKTINKSHCTKNTRQNNKLITVNKKIQL